MLGIDYSREHHNTSRNMPLRQVAWAGPRIDTNTSFRRSSWICRWAALGIQGSLTLAAEAPASITFTAWECQHLFDSSERYAQT